MAVSCVSAKEISNSTENLTQQTYKLDNTSVQFLSAKKNSQPDKSFKIFDGERIMNLKDYSGVIEVKNNSKVLLLKNFRNISEKSSVFYNMSFNLKSISHKECSNIKITLENQANLNTTGEISPIIKELAEIIVGKTEGLAAVKKLAEWVSENIVHEKGSGFYQSPVETLIRKKGNCCCHSDLFLQLCASLGYTEKYDMYYIHVGTMKFGKRHFFTMVGDLCVDADKKNPWGRGGFNGRLVYSITKYPYLPLLRHY